MRQFRNWRTKKGNVMASNTELPMGSVGNTMIFKQMMMHRSSDTADEFFLRVANFIDERVRRSTVMAGGDSAAPVSGPTDATWPLLGALRNMNNERENMLSEAAKIMREQRKSLYEPTRSSAGKYAKVASAATQQPEGEAVPAKVASLDTLALLGLFEEACKAGFGEDIEVAENAIIAHIDAKLAEARQAGRIKGMQEEGQVARQECDEVQQRAERAEAARDWNLQQALDWQARAEIAEFALTAQVPQAGQAPDVRAKFEAEYCTFRLDRRADGDGYTNKSVSNMWQAFKRAAAIYSPPAIPQQAGQAVDEPTEAMLNAARDWSVKKYGIGIGNDAAIGCWKAMKAVAAPPASAAPVEQVKK